MNTSRKRFGLKVFAFTAVAVMFLSGVYLVNDAEEDDGSQITLNPIDVFNSAYNNQYNEYNQSTWYKYTCYVGDSFTCNETSYYSLEPVDRIPGLTFNPNGYRQAPNEDYGTFYAYKVSGTFTTAGIYKEIVCHIEEGDWYSPYAYILIEVLAQYTTTFVCNDYNLGGVNVGQFTVPANSTLTVSNNYATVNGSTATAYTNNIDGYNVSFSGWTYSFDGSNWGWLGTSGSITVTGNVYIGANFSATIKTYSVAYIYNNTQVMWESVNHGSKITHPTYSNGNLVFCGWYYDNNQYFDPNTAVYRDYTLYAYMVEPLTFTSSPVANATLTYASEMSSILFDALKSESAYRVLWDFGDGTYGDEVVMYHHYEEPGTYNVKLSVFNYNNDADTRDYVVTIYDAAYPPESNDNTLLIAGSVIAALVVGFIIARPF